MNESPGWLAEASGETEGARSLAASLGWMLDSMDVMLYAMVLGEIQREMHLSAATGGAMMSATLICGGRRRGRLRLVRRPFGRVSRAHRSACCSIRWLRGCAASRTRPVSSWSCRFCWALAWAANGPPAPLWSAETWPARHRAKALALVQSSWAVGYALGAAVVALVLPRLGWRAVFFAGIVPALIAFWVRRGLREPEAWQRQRVARVPVGRLFRGPWGATWQSAPP